MSLKYYATERARYGEMGSITPDVALVAINKACHRFNLPRAAYVVTTRRRTRSCYKPGLNMLRPDGRLAPALGVPTLVMAPSMQNWLVFCHELAHHMHAVEFNSAAVTRAMAAKVNPYDSSRNGRLDFQLWARSNVKRQHWHGHYHRVAMQKLVDFFLEIGMITVLPTYKTMAGIGRLQTVGQMFAEEVDRMVGKSFANNTTYDIQLSP